MAIAGKVAITLSTENGGAWSADVTYDRLVAVKHNNNLYISRKTVANVEPPNNEFWFLALEGFGGDDVQTLIDRMNELSDLIQAIIDGATQVGNAKTLDGNEAEYFATADDLSNYLPKSGGTVGYLYVQGESKNGYSHIMKNASAIVDNGTDFIDVSADNKKACLNVSALANEAYFRGNDNIEKTILHTGNKPTGTYTGNGSATERKIDTKGIDHAIIIRTNGSFSIVSPQGAIIASSSGVTYVDGSTANFANGVLTLKTDIASLNASGVSYSYQVL